MRILNAMKRAHSIEVAQLKAIAIVNGKFDKSVIMREAWARARRLSKHYDCKPCECFAESLKQVWDMAKN